MGSQFDRPAISFFRLCGLAQTLVSIRQAAKGLVAGWLGFERAFKFSDCLLVSSSSLVERPQADMRSWESAV